MDQQPAAPQTNNAPVTTPNPAPVSAPVEQLPGTPPTWPGAFAIYKYSKQAVMLNIKTILILWLIVIVVSLITYKLGGIGQLISNIVSLVVEVGMTFVLLAGVRGQRLAIGDALGKIEPMMVLKMLGLTILVGLSIVVSILLLFIPVIFVLPRLYLATYFLIDQKLGIMDAYKASLGATKGHIGKVWGIIGAGVAMVLLAITIIGIPFAIYFSIMYYGASAVLYEFLRKSAGASPASPAVAAPATPVAAPPAAV